MKIIGAASLIVATVSAGIVQSWNACTVDTDCAIRTDRCCTAYKLGSNSVSLCGRVYATEVPSNQANGGWGF